MPSWSQATGLSWHSHRACRRGRRASRLAGGVLSCLRGTVVTHIQLVVCSSVSPVWRLGVVVSTDRTTRTAPPACGQEFRSSISRTLHRALLRPRISRAGHRERTENAGTTVRSSEHVRRGRYSQNVNLSSRHVQERAPLLDFCRRKDLSSRRKRSGDRTVCVFCLPRATASIAGPVAWLACMSSGSAHENACDENVDWTLGASAGTGLSCSARAAARDPWPFSAESDRCQPEAPIAWRITG